MERNELKEILNESFHSYLSSQKEKETLEEYFQIHKERFLYLLVKIGKIIGTHPKAKILDVGIFPPFLTLSLIKLGTHVEGLSSPLEESSYPGLITHQLNVEIEKLPYKNASFDLVIFTEIIEHFYRSPKHALTEIKRVLKPGGSLIITTPNLTKLINRLKIASGQTINQDIDYYTQHFDLNELYFRHNREYTLEELKRLVAGLGFQINESRFFTSYTPNRGRRNKPIVQTAKWFYYFLTKARSSWQDSLYLEAKAN